MIFNLTARTLIRLKIIAVFLLFLIVSLGLFLYDLKYKRNYSQWFISYYEAYIGEFDPPIDCVRFSNDRVFGILPEYKGVRLPKQKMHEIDAIRTVVEYPSFNPLTAPSKNRISFSVSRTNEGFNERMYGPDSYNHYSGFEVEDGEIYGLERWQLPPSDGFRNLEFYKYVPDSGYRDGAFIEYFKNRTTGKRKMALCTMDTEYEGGILIASHFDKSLLPNWKDIKNKLELFLNEKLIKEWGQQCNI